MLCSKFLPVILKSNWFWFLFQVDTIKSLTKFATVKIRVAPVYFTFWEFKNNFDDEQKKFGKLQRTAKDVFLPHLMSKQFPVPQTKHFETLLFPILKSSNEDISTQVENIPACFLRYKYQKEIGALWYSRVINS